MKEYLIARMTIMVANDDLHSIPNPIMIPLEILLNTLGLFSNFIKLKRNSEIRNVNSGSVISGARQH
jgi:hypothetical protein|tara:strand:- start:1105 stop:1305 length:201 start_codon:yes stop_codon:yes gene_type:complete